MNYLLNSPKKSTNCQDEEPDFMPVYITDIDFMTIMYDIGRSALNCSLGEGLLIGKLSRGRVTIYRTLCM